MFDAPCKSCSDRYLGCHSVCEKYIMYRRDRDKFYKKKSISRDIDAYIDDEKGKNAMRRKKKYGQI